MESHEVSSVDLVSGEVITSSIKENKSDCVPKEPVDIQYDNKESYDTSKHGEPNDKTLCLTDISNNNRGNECSSTDYQECDENYKHEGNLENGLKDICQQDQVLQIKSAAESAYSQDQEEYSIIDETSKNSATNCTRNQDYRLNLTGVEGTLLEAVPEDSTVPELPLLEDCIGTEKVKKEIICTKMDSCKLNDNHSTETNINNGSLQEMPSDILFQSTNCYYETKKECAPYAPLNIPESNVSDVSECSIATNATGLSQRERYLTQILTKTEALTARQQVALWLTRTSMSDLSSMPSLKNLVYPPSIAKQEPPSRSSQSSHCSCYHHTHRKSNGNNKYSSRPLSTAMSDCCFDAKTTFKQTTPFTNSPISPKANIDEQISECTKNKNIRRNYSTKSLMGGFSFGFRGVGSSKSYHDNKREKITCEEKEYLMPSPIGFHKCETVIALSGANTGSPSGPDDSGTCPNVTSTVIKRRHQHFHNYPSSHSCSVNNVRMNSGYGNTSPSTEAIPNTSKRSTSLSLFKKLSSSKEKSCNRSKIHGNITNGHGQVSSKQVNNASFGDGPASHYGVTSNTSNTCESLRPGITPINRHRSNASIACSRCTSAFSMNASRMTSRATSQMSLLQMASCRRLSTAGSSIAGYNVIVNPVGNSGDDTKDNLPELLCKICLIEYPHRDMFKLHDCSCTFCRECMVLYVTMEITEGAYEISCPDSECEKQDGKLQMTEIENLVGPDLLDKHKKFRLDTEVALDTNRAWCPQAGCNTICHICTSSDNNSTTKRKFESVAVKCPTCDKEFCSLCSANWHPGLSCAQNGNALFTSASNAKRTNSNNVLNKNTSLSISKTVGQAGDFLLQGSSSIEGDIKRCPMCNVPIERDAGCAQMMCKRCKHVFCWFCLTSLDEDFLLRHYDSGECKGLLGHTRASVLWHRAQVIGIFAGFGILLLMASPLLLMAAPCIFCCNCKTCQKVEVDGGEQDGVSGNLKKESSVVKDDNGVFGRFSSGFRIGGAVRKDSDDVTSINSPMAQSASARFDAPGTPPPSFTAEPYKENAR